MTTLLGLLLGVAILGALLSGTDRVFGHRHPVLLRNAWRGFFVFCLAVIPVTMLFGATAGTECLPSESGSRVWFGGLLFMWMMGIAGFALLWRRRRQEARRALRSTVEISSWEGWSEAIRRAGLRRAPLLRRAAIGMAASPFVTDLAGPTLVLTPEWERLPTRLRDGVVAHELAHLNSADLLWDRVAQMAMILYFFHPSVRSAFARYHRAVERAADRQAIESGISARVLAQAIVQLGDGSSLRGARAWAGPGGFASLRDRLEGLEQGMEPRSSRGSVMALLGVGLAWSAGSAALASALPRSVRVAEAEVCAVVPASDFVRDVLRQSELERPYSAR